MDFHTFSRIKHLQNEDKLNANQISKELKIDFKTAQRWMKRDRFIKRKPVSKPTILEPYKNTVKGLLERHEYTAVQVYQKLRDEGYTGSYSMLSHYIALVRPPKKPAFLTVMFDKGEASQVDFAYCGYIRLENITRRLYAFIMTLCYSRMIYVEFIMKQNQEHFLQCHRNAFEYFQSVPETVIVDNCKVAVLENSRYGEVKINPHFSDFAQHYGFKVRACSVRRPMEKGLVENSVNFVKRNLLNGIGEIKSLDAVNNQAKYWMENIANIRKHRTTGEKPVDMFKTEKDVMNSLPLFPYDCAVIKTVKSNSRFRVSFESNLYSVPAEYASNTLKIKIYPHELLIYKDDKLIAKHKRSFEKNRNFENPDHVKALLEQKRNAKDRKLLQHFLTLSANAEKYYAGIKQRLFNVRIHIRKIMALVDIYGADKVAPAIDDALKLQAYSSEYIANILEQRERLTPEASPLHLIRKQDLLELEVRKTDIRTYTEIAERN